jgi:hypothetical protein
MDLQTVLKTLGSPEEIILVFRIKMALKFPCRYCPQAFRSKRSRGQHEKSCKKGKKQKAYRWHVLSEADKAYIDDHGADTCIQIGRALGFDQSTIYRYRQSKPAVLLAPEDPPIEEAVEDIDPLKAQLLKGGPSNRLRLRFISGGRLIGLRLKKH